MCHKFSFQVTAIANAKTSQQLYNFNIALQKVYPYAERSLANNWIVAFKQLSDYLEGVKGKEKQYSLMSCPGLTHTHLDLYRHWSISGTVGHLLEMISL